MVKWLPNDPNIGRFYTAALVINTNLAGSQSTGSSCLLSAVCSDINCGAAGVRAMIYTAVGYCYSSSGKYYYGVGGGAQISTDIEMG